jgi:hypothetical protein
MVVEGVLSCNHQPQCRVHFTISFPNRMACFLVDEKGSEDEWPPNTPAELAGVVEGVVAVLASASPASWRCRQNIKCTMNDHFNSCCLQ